MPTKKRTKANGEGRAVIVTTEYRGVYFGFLKQQTGRECVLENARMAIYWGTTRGVDQLAQSGPTGKSRIGDLAPSVWLCGLTSVVDCTDASVKAWLAVS